MSLIKRGRLLGPRGPGLTSGDVIELDAKVAAAGAFAENSEAARDKSQQWAESIGAEPVALARNRPWNGRYYRAQARQQLWRPRRR